MKVIHANKTNSVGLICDPENILHIGVFKPALLKEWYKLVEQMYGDDQDIHLFIRQSDQADGWVIYASSNGDNPFVAVCGLHPNDGKWEQKYCRKV